MSAARGDLVWGVRASFRRYVEMVGEIEVTSPATREPDGRIRFAEEGAEDAIRRFRGVVSFRGHHGALAVVIRDPWLEPSASGGATLTVDAGGRRHPLAAVNRDGSAALCAEGVALFDFQYPVGTDLDPIALAQAPAARF